MTAALLNGAALVRIFRVILRNEHTILTVSSRVAESMGLGEVFLSLPSIIDRHGVARVLPMALNGSEQAALESSIKAVPTNIATLSEMIPI